MRLLLGSLLAFSVVSCAGIPTINPINPDAMQLSQDKIYKMDLGLEVNKIKSEGMLVVPRADKYEIKIKAPNDVDVVTFTTCTREEILREQDDEFKFVYTPNEIEREACPLMISAYAPKFRYAGGLFEVRNLNEAKGTLFCNGRVEGVESVAVCQVRSGLTAVLRFEAEMDVAAPKAGCAALVSDNKKEFRVTIGKDLCSYRLREAGESKKWFRLVTYGYEEFNIFR
jgi:hypothetical protein